MSRKEDFHIDYKEEGSKPPCLFTQHPLSIGCQAVARKTGPTSTRQQQFNPKFILLKLPTMIAPYSIKSVGLRVLVGVVGRSKIDGATRLAAALL